MSSVGHFFYRESLWSRVVHLPRLTLGVDFAQMSIFSQVLLAFYEEVEKEETLLYQTWFTCWGHLTIIMKKPKAFIVFRSSITSTYSNLRTETSGLNESLDIMKYLCETYWPVIYRRSDQMIWCSHLSLASAKLTFPVVFCLKYVRSIVEILF